MVYREGNWTLYQRDVELNGGRTQRIYFFSKKTPKSGKPADLPQGYKVIHSDRTGLPLLKKKGGAFKK